MGQNILCDTDWEHGPAMVVVSYPESGDVRAACANCWAGYCAGTAAELGMIWPPSADEAADELSAAESNQAAADAANDELAAAADDQGEAADAVTETPGKAASELGVAKVVRSTHGRRKRSAAERGAMYARLREADTAADS